MQKPFEEAVYVLDDYGNDMPLLILRFSFRLSIKEGELVGPVDTDSGIHLILRVPVA